MTVTESLFAAIALTLLFCTAVFLTALMFRCKKCGCGLICTLLAGCCLVLLELLLNPSLKLTVSAVCPVAVLMLAAEIYLCRLARIFQAALFTQMTVKNAADTFPTGICCWYPTGRILMRNRSMENLCLQLTGEQLVNGNTFYTAVLNACEKFQAAVSEKTDTETLMVFMKDGTVRLFRKTETVYEKHTVYLLTAVDISEKHWKSQALLEEQERAKQTYERYLAYRQQITELTISEETLRTKIRIHDGLGESLLAIRRFLANRDDPRRRESARELTALLRKNAELLHSEQPEEEQDPLDRVSETAERAGVNLYITGKPPKEKDFRVILAYAVQEEMTNTLRHAGGNELYIQITDGAANVTAILLNNGKQPEEPVREGGGLSQLRKLVENINGTMTIEIKPRFALIITLPKEVLHGV